MSTTLPAIPWTSVGRTAIHTTRLGIGTWGFGPIGAPATRVGDDEALVAVLERVRWNRAEASRVLKVSYKTLLNKISEHELTPSWRQPF